MSIITFGSRERKQVCYAVTVAMNLKNDMTKELTLLSIPFICEPLTIPPVCIETEDYDYLCHAQELADLFEENGRFQPDVLVGADYYWDLMTGETICSNKGPVAVHTSRLGFVRPSDD